MNRPKILEEAVEGLYSTFSTYLLPENTMPCPCCHSENANELLHAEPLRQLQWMHLGEYAKHAMAVWGDLDCYKHFLPRIFDLTLDNPAWGAFTPSPAYVFKACSLGNWRSWPSREQIALASMLDAIWESVRTNPPIDGGYIDVEMWLCSISQLAENLTPFLSQWTGDSRLSAAWSLASLILGSTIAYAGNDHYPPAREEGEERAKQLQEWYKLPHRNPWWKSRDLQYAQLQEWARSPAALEKLLLAELTCGDTRMEKELAAAQKCIREAQNEAFEVVYKRRAFQTAYWESPTYHLF